MPQVDTASFLNQIFYFFLVFFFLFLFFVRWLLKFHFLVLRMRSLNPIKLLFWRSCFWYYILSFKDKNGARYHYYFYYYYQEYLKVLYFVDNLLFQFSETVIYNNLPLSLLHYRLKFIVQNNNIENLMGELQNDFNSK